MNILVTGGAGFIGSALIRLLLAESPHRVVNLDKLSYAGHLDSLPSAAGHPRYAFVQADIGDAEAVRAVFREHAPDAVLHLAAETHVDRSLDDPEAFVQTNLVGSYRLLQESLRYWRGLPAARAAAFRFHQVSTDEVYGSLGATDRFREDSPYAPTSPYSASKAGADHLLRAWQHSYGLPVLLSNCSNNYGPYQFPEKLIPLMILNALAGQPLPVYGRGEHVRDWLYVDDHARALRLILERGQPGEQYNVGGGNERRNLEVVHHLCALLDELHPQGAPHARLIAFVPDRPGHDSRYALDAGKIERELGWRPQESFDSGLRKTVLWYLEHCDWCERVQGAYRRERLGLPSPGPG